MYVCMEKVNSTHSCVVKTGRSIRLKQVLQGEATNDKRAICEWRVNNEAGLEDRRQNDTFRRLHTTQENNSLWPWEFVMWIRNTLNGKLSNTIVIRKIPKPLRRYTTRPGHELQQSGPHLMIVFAYNLPEPHAHWMGPSGTFIISHVICVGHPIVQINFGQTAH